MVHTATICVPYQKNHGEWFILFLEVVHTKYEGLRTKNKNSRSIKQSPFKKPSVGIAYHELAVTFPLEVLADGVPEAAARLGGAETSV